MLEFWEKITALNEKHWQEGIYQWIFYACVLLVLILEKRQMARIVFGWVPVVFLLCIYNPLFIKAMELAGASDNQYFVRMFSFMPLMYVIARGFMCLLEKAKEWLKLILVILSCALFVLTGNSIYQQTWFVKADNSAKVDKDTYEVAEALKNENDAEIRIAAFDPVAKYIRQVGDYVTPYARWIKIPLGKQLSQNPPDVPFVMNAAGEQDIDYILVHKTEETLAAFDEYGYKPYALTTNLVVYKVTGVKRTKRILDENRRIRSITNYNENGEIIPFEKGYSTIAYDYDDNGYCIRETYFDQNGELYQIYSNYASVTKEYSARGLLKSYKYWDITNNPVLIYGRYETRCKHDLSGNLIRESYYDANGLPMMRTDEFYSSMQRTYDNKRNIESEIYFDTEGNRTLCNKGYAEVQRKYDNENRVIHESYLGKDGKPITILAGYAAVSRIYKDQGSIVYESYEDEKGHPVNSLKGYAKQETIYDDEWNIILQRYFDTEDNLIEIYTGYAEVQRVYDDDNRLFREEYFGTDSARKEMKAGYVAIEQEYDNNNRLTVRRYIGENAETVMRKDGYAEAKWIYNAETRSFDVKFYTDTGENVEPNGINLAKDIPGDDENWSEWMYPRNDVENSTMNLATVNLGEKHEGDVYTCRIEIEFKNVHATEGKVFRFYTQGAADGSWSVGNIWDRELVFLDQPPQDGIYVFTVTKRVNAKMAGVTEFDLGLRCDYWNSGMFRVRSIKVEKGDSATPWSPGI